MKQFLDTSVLISAFWEDHPHHEASFRLFAAANRKHSDCAVHSLAEVYAVMSVLPIRPVIPPEQVLLFLDQIRERCALFALDEDEYTETIRETAERHFAGGRVYDALLLGCAVKAKAEKIYTWNVKHFQALAPGLAERIHTPI
jgi:predicted nucleic acid-binding protein